MKNKQFKKNIIQYEIAFAHFLFQPHFYLFECTMFKLYLHTLKHKSSQKASCSYPTTKMGDRSDTTDNILFF